jgi:hypothetical protein
MAIFPRERKRRRKKMKLFISLGREKENEVHAILSGREGEKEKKYST